MELVDFAIGIDGEVVGGLAQGAIDVGGDDEDASFTAVVQHSSAGEGNLPDVDLPLLFEQGSELLGASPLGSEGLLLARGKLVPHCLAIILGLGFEELEGCWGDQWLTIDVGTEERIASDV